MRLRKAWGRRTCCVDSPPQSSPTSWCWPGTWSVKCHCMTVRRAGSFMAAIYSRTRTCHPTGHPDEPVCACDARAAVAFNVAAVADVHRVADASLTMLLKVCVCLCAREWARRCKDCLGWMCACATAPYALVVVASAAQPCVRMVVSMRVVRFTIAAHMCYGGGWQSSKPAASTAVTGYGVATGGGPGQGAGPRRGRAPRPAAPDPSSVVVGMAEGDTRVRALAGGTPLSRPLRRGLYW